MHDGIDKLIRYDAKAWEMSELPQPEEGYSRGDMLGGFRGTGTTEGFWLEGGGHAWRWRGQNLSWEPIQTPRDYRLARIIPLPGRVLLVRRHTSLSFLVKKDDDFQSDTVQYFDSQWKEVPNKTGKSYLAKHVVVIKDVSYLLTESGLIFQVTPSKVTILQAPNDCEAIAATTSGSLLASIRDFGIYEYKNEWRKIFSPPYSSAEAEHWAYLAESGGRVAFAITTKPQKYGESTKYPGQTTLWLSAGAELKAISLGER